MSLALIGTAFLCCASADSAHKPDAKNGEKLFDAYHCIMCHPAGGNTVHPDKPLKGVVFQKRCPTDQAIAQLVRNGVPGTAMEPFGKDVMTDDQLADIIAYVRTLTPCAGKSNPSTTSQTKKAAAKSESAKGKQCAHGSRR